MTWNSLCEPKRAGPSGGEHNEDDQTDRSERDGEELGRLEAGKDRGLVAQKEQAEPDHRNGNEVDGRGGTGAKIGQTLTADPQKDKEARKRECFIGLGRLESDVVGRHRRRVSVDECPGERGRDPRRIACDDAAEMADGLSNGRRRSGCVGHDADRDAVAPSVDHKGDQSGYQAAEEGQPSIPDHDGVERIDGKHRKVVLDLVEHSAADQGGEADPDRAIGEDRVGNARRLVPRLAIR